MTPLDLAGIIERDADSSMRNALADRRALLGLLRETREALAISEAEVKRLGMWVANRKARDKQGYQRWRETHPDDHRRMSRESMARTRARRKLSGAEP